MKKVICIGGHAQNGKDTSADFLKEKLENKGERVLILHYADYLKFICGKYFGYKGTKSEEDRKILQEIGTNIVRERYPDFWVDIIKMFLDVFGVDYDYFLLSDFRFPNESQELRFNAFPVITLQINRINFDNKLPEEQKKHSSETSLDDFDFDYVINVGEGLDLLEKEVEKFICYFNL